MDGYSDYVAAEGRKKKKKKKKKKRKGKGKKKGEERKKERKIHDGDDDLQSSNIYDYAEE